MTEKSKRKFFELRNGLKAVDFRNKDYFDRIDEHEKSLYWLDKRPFKFDKRMNEFKISSKGIRDLSSYQ